MRSFLASLALLCTLLASTAEAAGLQLLLVRDDICNESARWLREIGPSYGASPEGQHAPLVQIASDGPWPGGLVIGRRPHLSPTFILTRDGQEIGRIEGYSGPAKFWAELDRMLP